MPSHQSKIEMLLGSSGKTLSVGSASRDQSYLIMAQFYNRVYQDFCQELKIRNLYSTLQYPQSNGQAEASNKTLLTALKKRLDSAKGKLMEELPEVL